MNARHLSVIALVTSATVLGAILPAGAADLPATQAATYYPDASMALATDTWSGFYAGASAGYITSDDFNENNSAWTGGVQAGYLQQFDMFVIGAELQGLLSNELDYELVPGAGLRQNWSVAAKARAGVALGNTLIYGTAGGSFAELEPTGATSSARETHAGLVFGGGVEQALGNNLSLRAEYLQTRYFGVQTAIAGVGREDDLVNHAITLGVNYRF